VQFTRDVPKDDEQYILKTIILYKGVLENYMDNFIIPDKTKKELEERMIQFLKIAEKHNLCFKQSKCDFDTEKIPILGVVVG